MLPTGFKLDNYGHIQYYNKLIGNIQDNVIQWTNERINYIEYKMLKQQLEQSGYIVKWEN